jgi:hypothetical protein
MPDEKDREEDQIENDLATQEDLNQGMSTGTHESTRLGVKWPASYRRKLRAPAPKSTKGKPATPSTTANKSDDAD